MEYIALALSLVAVILCIVILTKVNKLLTMLRTPIFKKLTPDMNLKPASRRPISAQEMAQRGERKENRQNNNGKDRPAKENRDKLRKIAKIAPLTNSSSPLATVMNNVTVATAAIVATAAKAVANRTLKLRT